MLHNREQKGAALILCLLTLMLLSGLAFSVLYLTDSETMVNNNYRSSQQAYEGALAGLQNVRERMTPGNAAPRLLVGPTAMPGNADSIMYVVNPHDSGDTVNLAGITSPSSPYYDAEIQKELLSQGMSFPAAGSNYTALQPEDPVSFGSAGPNMGLLNYKWVRVNLKANKATSPSTNGSIAAGSPVCYNGAGEITAAEINVNGAPITDCFQGTGGSNPPNWTPVYELTSLAVTPSGATRMLQMEVAQDPPILTNGAVDSQDNVHLNGNLTVNGYDYCSCACTATDSKGTCTAWGDPPGRPGSCDKSKYAIYSSGTVDPPNSAETIVSGRTPPYAENQPWPWNMDDLVSRYGADAIDVTTAPYNWNCSGGDCGTQSNASLGTQPSTPPTAPVDKSTPGYQVTYVPGNVRLSGNGSQGFGILVVDGNLDIHGGFSFDGLIVVRGVISFTGGGSDGVNVYGGIIAGQQSLVDTVLGGSVNISYDQCALPQSDKTQPPRMLSLRDINF
jgi:hypothetical protein